MTDPQNNLNPEHVSDPHTDSAPQDRSQQTELLSGQIPSGTGLGKYRFLERIRTTHNAIIYKARDSMLDRSVMIKQMNPRLVDSPIACGNFKREAQLLAGLSKDVIHVINILELIEVQEGLFIIEPYIPGDWLETLISKRLVNTTDAVPLLKAICLGCLDLHSRRIVHRNIQPDNLIVPSDGHVRIVDLSCAALEGDMTPPPIFNPKYAAPELQAGGPHDARVDIYAAGMILYEICVGRAALRSYFTNLPSDPREAQDYWKKWHTDVTSSLPDATDLNTTVAPALSSILRMMTAKDLERRYATAQEILGDLAKQFNIQDAPAPIPISLAPATRVIAFHTPLLSTTFGLSAIRPLPHDGATISHSFAHGYQMLSTSTHSAVPFSRGGNERATGPQKWHAPAESPSRQRTAYGPRSVAYPSHRRRDPAHSHVVMPTKIPLRLPIEEPPHRHRHRHLFLAMIGSIFLVSLIMVVIFQWNRMMDDSELQTLRQILTEGNAAYLRNDFPLAMERFQKVVILGDGHLKMKAERKQAEFMMMMTNGLLALQHDDFDKVEKIIREAETKSTTPATLTALESLRDKYWSKKDAYRLEAESNIDLKQNRFMDVEMKLNEYEKRARSAGLDESLLKSKLKLARRNREYDEVMKNARSKLAQKDFEAAQIACSLAEAIKITSATRKLRKDIQDAIRRDNWIIRGDNSMHEGDYAEAEKAYLAANEIIPTRQIELKYRSAAASRLVEEAKQSIDKGDLLNAKRLLNSSMWKSPNALASNMLEQMAPAFDAARLAHLADRAAKDADYNRAIRLYKKAIPKLPAPANEIVRGKLLKAKQATTQPRG